MAEQTGIELKLENGNVIKAENADEALKVAAKMIEDNSKAYRETKASLDQMQAQMGTLQAQIEAAKPKEVSTNGFDKDRYYKLLSDDPVTANDYWFEHRFGRKPDEVAQDFQQLDQRITAFEGQSLAAGFVNQHPEFPQDAESAKTFTERMAVLTKEGHPANLTTMNMAWQQLVSENRIKPLEEEKDDRESLPPSLGGTNSSISPSELQKAESLSNKELEALLKSKGML